MIAGATCFTTTALTPREWLLGEAPPRIAPGQRLDAQLTLPAPAQVSSYSLTPCLRDTAGALHCLGDAGSSFRIGEWEIGARAVLAPMAGVTDRPFRILCRQFGAGLAASEMITSDQRLWHTTKTRQRMNHEGEPEPRVVQLAGNDPVQLADAARVNVDLGAQIIDINMGCPAKKVYGKLCGSALLGDPAARGPHPCGGGCSG